MPYARQLRHLKIPQNVRHSKALASGARHCHLISVEQTIFRLFKMAYYFHIVHYYRVTDKAM